MTDTQDLRPLIRAALAAGDKSGGVMTREGLSVTIYTADAPGPYPIHGSSCGAVRMWTFDGHIPGSYPLSLIPRPAPKRRVQGWLNVYAGDVHETKSDADLRAENERLREASAIALIALDLDPENRPPQWSRKEAAKVIRAALAKKGNRE